MKRIVLISMCIFYLTNFMTFAGQFGQNENGYYYLQDDGNLAKSKWVDIDLSVNVDWRYFNEMGLMAINTWVDDYYVGTDGKLIPNGVAPDGTILDENGKRKNNSIITKIEPTKYLLTGGYYYGFTSKGTPVSASKLSMACDDSLVIDKKTYKLKKSPNEYIGYDGEFDIVIKVTSKTSYEYNIYENDKLLGKIYYEHKSAFKK